MISVSHPNSHSVNLRQLENCNNLGCKHIIEKDSVRETENSLKNCWEDLTDSVDPSLSNKSNQIQDFIS